MAKLRKACAYRTVERPYTRTSKFREKSYVRANPNILIVRFDMGNPKKKFRYTLKLRTKKALQIRHNALESARQVSNRILEENLGKNAYSMKIMIYPHHILRENPLAAGAGADRFSTGMAHSFGKPISAAAQVKKDQILMKVSVNSKSNLELAKKALKAAATKLPCSCRIE
jgi:large subunit ribosomal protein L10e